MNKKRVHLFVRHPAEKSLSIFPIVPKVKSSFTTSRARTNFKVDKTNLLDFNSTVSKYKINDSDRFKELQAFRHTSSVLRSVENRLPNPSKKSSGNVVSLPPIDRRNKHELPKNQRYLNHEEFNKGYTAFILPVVSREKCSCSCSKSKDADADNARLKGLAKVFRPEETPPMFSVYVRWKNCRNGEVEYNQDSLHGIFHCFGEISKVLMKSRSSAILTFMQIESACNAARVMKDVGKEMKLHVKWLRDVKT